MQQSNSNTGSDLRACWKCDDGDPCVVLLVAGEMPSWEALPLGPCDCNRDDGSLPVKDACEL